MQIAVLGIGVMGSAIAGRLLDVGHTVHLYNRSPHKCAPLQARGAHLASSPRAATAPAQFVISSLSDAAAVEHVVFGTEGVALAADAGKVLVDMSSIDPERTAEMAARLHAATGMGWIDAPLSGGAPAAAKGALTLMVGGSDAHVARARPLLDQLAARATHLGAAGAGQTVKLVNQVLCALGFLAVAEAVRFAEAAGVDATQIPAALAGGRADSRILQEFMAKMARRDYSVTGRIANMLKDLESVQAAAHARRVPMPLTSLVADLHRMLVAAGRGDADNAEYMRLFDLPSDSR